MTPFTRDKAAASLLFAPDAWANAVEAFAIPSSYALRSAAGSSPPTRKALVRLASAATRLVRIVWMRTS
jgi:hypothetical protein